METMILLQFLKESKDETLFSAYKELLMRQRDDPSYYMINLEQPFVDNNELLFFKVIDDFQLHCFSCYIRAIAGVCVGFASIYVVVRH